MYCTKCGKELPDSAKFCPQCGERTVRAASAKPGIVPEGFAQRCKAALLAVASALLALTGRAMDSEAGQRLRGFRWRESRRLLPGLIALISLALLAPSWVVVTHGEQDLFDFRYDLYEVIDEIAWRSDRVGGFSDAGDVKEALFEISDGKISPIEWNHFCGQIAPMVRGFRSWALALGAKDTGDFDKLVAFFYGYIALFVACAALGIATVIARFAGKRLHINRAYFIVQLLHLIYFCFLCAVITGNAPSVGMRPTVFSFACVVLAALTGPRGADAIAPEGARVGYE